MSKSQGTGIVLLVVPQHLGANNAVKPTAYGGGLLLTLVPSYSALCRPAFIPASRLSQRFLLWGLGRPRGFACMRCASLQPFWPPALASQALPAIFIAALRRFRGAALFRGPRPSSSQGVPFWPSGLTRRSSRPAYGGRLTLGVSPFIFPLYAGCY